MATPGVLINANARSVRRDPGLLARLVGLASRERIAVSAQLDEIEPALASLLDRGIDSLVVVGGDGTFPHTLTRLLRLCDPAKRPAIVPTRGGTVNTVARSLGARGAPDETLAQLLRGELREQRRAVVRVAADGDAPVFGFLFVNGVGVRFLELYYAGATGPAGALSVVGRLCASALVGGPLARRAFAAFEAELEVDGKAIDQRHFTVIAAGAVRHLGLGFAPLHSAGSDPERIHLATTGASAARIALQLPALRAGSRGGSLAHFPCRQAELRLAAPLAWSLDAELFPPARRLAIAAEPALRFLCPPVRDAYPARRRCQENAMALASPAPQLDVTRLSGSLGAEIRGIALAKACPADADVIRSLLMDHQVLFFPGQRLTPDEHIAFGRLFGKLEPHPNLSLGGERPEFFELRANSGAGAIADEWHSDLTCQAEPSLLSILHMVKCPPVGGDTIWANAYKAYDELSPAMKDFCEGLSALHDAHPHGNSDQMAIHPVVRVHPVTKKKSLFVNEHFTRRIVELSHQESDALLGFLVRWIQSPRFTVRYHWTPGTIAMWDNRCTQHHVLNDFEGERVIQRVTVMGDHPEAARPPRWEPYVKYFSAASRHDRQLKKFLDNRSG